MNRRIEEIPLVIQFIDMSHLCLVTRTMRSLMSTNLYVFVSEVNHPDVKRSTAINMSSTTPDINSYKGKGRNIPSSM
jgi:hypothetical protein